MLIKFDEWDEIRAEFSEEEKKALRAHVTGESICPAGMIVDEDAAGSVGLKLKNILVKWRIDKKRASKGKLL